MTFEEANKIFKSWQSYMEIVDKLGKIFHELPESFLPYPPKVLEEALNIVAEKYFYAGDKKKSETIQETMGGFLFMHTDDEKALDSMCKTLDLILKHPELKDTYIEKLKESKDYWLKLKYKTEENI